jgi:DNA repair protein RecO (recombination protein O)
MKLFAAEAVILRHLDYGEADRIVTFYTAEHGVMKGFARNARKSRRRFGAGLEPFARVLLQWAAPRSGDLTSLRDAELLDLRAGLRNDLLALTLAGYGCELTEALLGDHPEQGEGFALVNAFLDHLAGGGSAAEARLLFELRLLEVAGYVPHLLHCSECTTGLAGPRVAFDAARGGSLCSACGPGAIELDLLTLGTLARILRSPLTAFAGVRLSPRTLAEGGALVAGALRLHLPRPLKSLAVLVELFPAEAVGGAG